MVEVLEMADKTSVGRARWKVHNENNNILKTKGYHLEQNFGHGKKYLSSLSLTFNILAFLFNILLGLMDDKYEQIRRKLPTRETFFMIFVPCPDICASLIIKETRL